MPFDSVYPVLMTDDVAESRRFYVENFGFQVTFENDWYVSLIQTDNPANQLAFIKHTHETIPDKFRQRVSGLVMNFEVSDANAEYERLQEAGLEIVQPIRDEAWGQRHFIGVDPHGLLIDIIQNIEPESEYAASYIQQPS